MKTAYKSIVSIVLVSLLVSLLPIRLAQGQPEISYIIVHALNPEGIEIASIQGVGQGSVPIYDGETLIGYGAYSDETHYRRIPISPGPHTIKVKFNGITIEQNININEGETQVLTFTFTRTEIAPDILFTMGTHTFEQSGEAGAPIYGWWWWNPDENYGNSDAVFSYVIFRGHVLNEASHVTDYLKISCETTPDLISFDMFVSAQVISAPPGSGINSIAGGCRGLTIPINISPRTDFSVWYIQQYSLISKGVDMAFSPKEAGYFINAVSATEGIYESKSDTVWIWDAKAFPNDCLNPSFNYNIQYTINGSNVKFSSVPYDLLGTGVKDGEKKPPVASFTYSPTNPMVGGNIIFDASESYDPDGGEITDYIWDFGDGNTAEEEVVTHTYAQPGEYTVQLIVRDDEGVTASTSDTVMISAIEIEVVDPYPDLISDGCIITDPERLADGGRKWVSGLAADGVTPLLIKAQVVGSGTVEFSLKDENGSPIAVGTLCTPGGNEGVTTLQVTVSKLSDGRYMAFAVLTAPPAFFRGPGDESLYGRPINIEANFTPSGGGYEATDNYETWLVRPPVVMVHGLWGNGGDFAGLARQLEENGWLDYFLYRPSYNNSASFATNDWVLPHLISKILSDLRTWGYACTKVDIVAHSMGGLLAKRLEPSFAQKNVRKIITIGTPYSGSPLADELWEALLYDPHYCPVIT